MQLKQTTLKHKYIPSKEGAPKAVLLLVHGRGGNIRLLEFFSKRFEVPGLSYLLLEAPFAEQREDQVASGESGWSWYLMPKFQGLNESRENLFSLLREIHAEGFDYTKIFWLGFSQGGCMGLEVFLQFPEKLGGLMCISALLPDSKRFPTALAARAKDQRIFISHGTRDEIISKERAEETYKPLFEAKLQIEYKIYDKPHSFHLNEEIPFLELKLNDWVSEK